MDVITIASLFPNLEQPRHGIFVEERLWHLRQACDARFHVVAPVPWFPFRDPRFGAYARYARVPSAEERRGLLVRHPRFPTIPRFGMSVQPFLYAAAIAPMLKDLVRGLAGPVVLDGQFLYPDGVATAMLARWLGLPYLLTARGSDVNLFPQFALPRRLILAACRGARKVITVSESLRDRLLHLGLPPDRVTVLRNGVDLARFYPVERTLARSRASLGERSLLAVGNLVPVKNHELMIRALAEIPDATLTIVGEGPLKDDLTRAASALNVSQRVRFVGNVSQGELVNFYSAADLSVLTSHAEGMPNVVLESLACGTPVVATACDGVAELLTCEAAGRLVLERSPTALATALRSMLDAPPTRLATRLYAETLGWGPTAAGLADLFRQCSLGTSPAVHPSHS